MIAPQQLDTLDPQQMRQALLTLMAEMAAKDELLERQHREVAFKQALVDKLSHELAVLKRLKFAATSEKFCAGLSAEQKACWRRRSTPTLLRPVARSSEPTAATRARRTSKVPSASRCRRTCRAARCSTSPRARPAAVAAR